MLEAAKPAAVTKPAVLTWDKVRTGDCCLQGELLEFGNGAGLPGTVTSVPCRRPHLGGAPVSYSIKGGGH
ncbi:MAG: hypothetical protein M3Z75_21140 [Actinomycetota bacterium]|nr:hypothetical protein [Actinomycetota bacterium]